MIWQEEMEQWGTGPGRPARGLCLGFKAEWMQLVYHDPFIWMLMMQKSNLTSEFSLDQSLSIRAIKSWSLKCHLHGICYRRRQLGQRLIKWGENNSVTSYFVCRTHFTFLKYLLLSAHFDLPSCVVRRTQNSSSPSLISLASSEVFGTRLHWEPSLLSFDLLLWEDLMDFNCYCERMFWIQLLLWENIPDLNTGSFLQNCVEFHYDVVILSLRKT